MELGVYTFADMAPDPATGRTVTRQRRLDDLMEEIAMTRLGQERGWPPVTRQAFEASRGPRGALAVGDPDEVAAKILAEHEVFGNTRFLAQLGVGTLPHADVLRSIELLGTEVAPVVRREVDRRTTAAA